MSTLTKILLIVAPIVIEYVIAYYMQEQKQKESKSHDNDSDSVSSTEHVL